jgi:hypothetical protein
MIVGLLKLNGHLCRILNFARQLFLPQCPLGRDSLLLSEA